MLPYYVKCIKQLNGGFALISDLINFLTLITCSTEKKEQRSYYILHIYWFVLYRLQVITSRIKSSSMSIEFYRLYFLKRFLLDHYSSRLGLIFLPLKSAGSDAVRQYWIQVFSEFVFVKNILQTCSAWGSYKKFILRGCFSCHFHILSMRKPSRQWRYKKSNRMVKKLLATVVASVTNNK